MATVNQILRAVYREKWQTTTAEQVPLTFKEFKTILLRADVYTSDPSIRNAWTRLAGAGVVRAERMDRKHPENRVYIFDIKAVRAELGEYRLPPRGEKKEKVEEAE